MDLPSVFVDHVLGTRFKLTKLAFRTDVVCVFEAEIVELLDDSYKIQYTFETTANTNEFCSGVMHLSHTGSILQHTYDGDNFTPTSEKIFAACNEKGNLHLDIEPPPPPMTKSALKRGS